MKYFLTAISFLFVYTYVKAQTTTTCEVTDHNLNGTLAVSEWDTFFQVVFEDDEIIIFGSAEEFQLDPIFLPPSVEVSSATWIAPYDGVLSLEYNTSNTAPACMTPVFLRNNVTPSNTEAIYLNEGDEIKAVIFWDPDVEGCLGDTEIVLSDISFTYDCPEGCTDQSADNYNPDALVQDGSCVYSSTCIADLDSNGVVDTSDLLTLLSQFGDTCN